MDNKKWYNRFASIFWWSLTILPLLIALIYFIGYHLTFNSGINTAQELSSYHMFDNGNIINYLEYITFNNSEDLYFAHLCIPFLTTMYSNLFISLNIEFDMLLAVLFSWMTSVQFYHLFFDFIIWLPKWFHCIMEKGFDKL